jgi:hypothetical protein
MLVKMETGASGGGGTVNPLEHITHGSSASSGVTYNYTPTVKGRLYVICDLQYNAGGHIKITIDGNLVIDQENGQKKIYGYVENCNANSTVKVEISSNSWYAVYYQEC